MKLLEIISDFLIAKEIEQGCTPKTIKAYKYDMKMLAKEIGNIDLDSIKVYHIRKFLKTLHNKNYSKSGIARKIACFKSFFNFCIENELIEKTPMKSIKSPRIKQEEQLPKFLSEDEVKQIFQIMGDPRIIPYNTRERMEVIIPLLYSSMARISELCNLKLKDIYFQEQLIKVRGKGNKERFIPIDGYTAGILEDYYMNRMIETQNNTDHWLFINSNRKQLTPRTVQKDLQKIKQALGWDQEKKLTPHVFRHTGATHLRKNGMDISELQDLLGHANPNTTRIYAKNDITALKSAHSKFHPLALLDNDN